MSNIPNYTGKTKGVSFSVKTTIRRQAIEYLRSRGFDLAARNVFQVQALALVLRDGSFRRDACAVLGLFSAQARIRGFTLLKKTGVIVGEDVYSPKLDHPVAPGYYNRLVRFVKIDDLPTTDLKPGQRKSAIVKYAVERIGDTGLLRFTPVGGGKAEQVEEAAAWERFTRLGGKA